MSHLQNNRQTKGHIHKTVGRREDRERAKDGGMDEGGREAGDGQRWGVNLRVQAKKEELMMMLMF